jgi:hypothetical protein
VSDGGSMRPIAGSPRCAKSPEAWEDDTVAEPFDMVPSVLGVRVDGLNTNQLTEIRKITGVVNISHITTETGIRIAHACWNP